MTPLELMKSIAGSRATPMDHTVGPAGVAETTPKSAENANTGNGLEYVSHGIDMTFCDEHT